MGADEILMDAEERMEGAVTHLAGELSGLRSGRASSLRPRSAKD